MLEMVKLPRNIAFPNVKLQYVLNSNANKFVVDSEISKQLAR